MQADLFSNVPEPTGKELKEKGMQTAIDHANAVNTGWSDLAFKKLQEYLDTVPGSFTSEDLRAFAAQDDNFPLPPNNRAWGGIISRAAHQSLIFKYGMTTHRAANCHQGNSQLWIKNVK